MKKQTFRIAGLLVVIAMLFSFAACGAAPTEPNIVYVSMVYADGNAPVVTPTPQNPVVTPTAAPAPQAPVETPTQGGETPTEAPTQGGETPTEAPSQGGETPTEAPQGGLLSTPADILARYTLVMDKAKTDAPAYTKFEYQSLPDNATDRVVNSGGGAVNTILNLAGNFFKSEDKATPEVTEKGTNMRWFPIFKNTKGCLLTDVSAIKSATCTQDGSNWKIVITLNDELNPEPTAEGTNSPVSNVGAMFGPLSRAEIDKTITENGAVKAVVKNPEYNLTYHDCTATIVFNPETNQLVNLEQVMVVSIALKAKVIVNVDVVQNLYSHYKAYDFAY